MEQTTVQDQASETEQPGAGETVETRQPELSVDELRELLERERKQRQEANREAQNIRKRLRELEAAEEERRKAELTELERLKAERDKLAEEHARLTAQLRDTIARNEVFAAATRLGAVDPEAVYALLGPIEFDDDGRPRDVEDRVRELLRQKPYLVGERTAVTNAARGPAPAVSREQELREIAYGRGAQVFDLERLRKEGGVKFD